METKIVTAVEGSSDMDVVETTNNNGTTSSHLSVLEGPPESSSIPSPNNKTNHSSRLVQVCEEKQQKTKAIIKSFSTCQFGGSNI